jgi:hypothetical protein
MSIPPIPASCRLIFPGSYAAVFHPSPILNTPLPPESVHQAATGSNTTALVHSGNGAAAPGPVTVPRSRRKMTVRAALWIVLAGTAGLCIGISLHTLPVACERQRLQIDPLDQFWSPITTAPGIATISVCEADGEYSKESNPAGGFDSAVSSSQPISVNSHFKESARLDLADVVTLTHIGAELESHHKLFRITVPSRTSFLELREGPAVLIGAFNNSWTMRVTQDMRFGFVDQNGIGTIIDRRGSARVRRSIPWCLLYKELSHDYAVVARVHDSTTGQQIVIAAAIGDAGTESAGEFLSDPDYFAALVKQAPSNWPAMNMEAVIEAEVIDGHPGPPHILAVEFW